MPRPFYYLSSGWLFALLLTFTAACTRETESQPAIPTLTPFPPDVYIGLSDSASPLASLVESALETMDDSRPPIFVVSNDEALLNDVQAGELESALVYYVPENSQLWFSPVALDGVAVITSPDVPVGTLSSGQLQGILAGSIKNWSEVGGPDQPITVLAREPGSAVSEVLRERMMRNVRLSGLARLIPTDEMMKQEVLAGEGAIGFIMMGSAENGSLAVDDSDATIDMVANQGYPLTSPIYFVSLVEPEGPLREFLAWLQSSEGQIVLSEKYGRVR